MERHPYFNLTIFTKDELEQRIQKPVSTMRTLREWPLSSVVEAVCDDGSEWIVKYMREPLNIEGVWYRQLNTNFLPHCDSIIDSSSDQQILIYRKIPGIHPVEAQFSEKQTLDLLEQMQNAIHSIQTPNLPVRIQVDTPENYSNCFQQMVDDMRRLVNDRQFTINDRNAVDFLQDLVNDHSVRDRLTGTTGYAHGDLGQDNILLHPDGSFTILDWQRPVLSSPLIDAYIFLDSMNIPPLRHLPAEALYLSHLERIEWYVANAVRWNPAIMARIDHFVDDFVRELRLVYPANTSNFKM